MSLSVPAMDVVPLPVLEDVVYSDKYSDDEYEYRHVTLNAQLTKLVPRTHLMSETEWRNLGVQQVNTHSIVCVNYSLQMAPFPERRLGPLHDAHPGAARPHVQKTEAKE